MTAVIPFVPSFCRENGEILQWYLKKAKKKPVTADSGNRIHLLLTYLHSDGRRTPKSKAINDFAQKNSNKHSDQIIHFISKMTIIYLTNYSLRYFSKEADKKLKFPYNKAAF